VRFDQQAVQDLIQRLELRPRGPQRPATVALDVGEWWVADLAQTLAMPRTTLENWIKRGWVQARRQVEVQGQRRWVVWADHGEMDRLRRQRQRPAGAILHDRWAARDGDARSAALSTRPETMGRGISGGEE